MKKLGIWLLLPALIMGSWAGPTRTSADIVTEPSQVQSVASEPSSLAQVEATPMVTEPEAPAPASSDPASTAPAKDAGSTTVAPADFPNVCDGSGDTTTYETIFTVDYPADHMGLPLQVQIYPENGGCIPGIGYAGPTLNFPDKVDDPNSQPVQLPAGRYVYQYSGEGFKSEWGIPFQVSASPPNTVKVQPAPLPQTQQVTLNVTIPDNGSSLVLVITDASGTVDSATVVESGPVYFNLPAGNYFYQYWGDDYPWSGEIEFTVAEGQETVIDITPTIPKITLDPAFGQAGQDRTVQVNVEGFRAFDEYDISFNGDVVARGKVDDKGRISRQITVSGNLAPGDYPIVVTGAVTGQRIEATFTVLGAAQFSVDPTSGPAGTIMSVSGSGYAPGEVVNIRLGAGQGVLRGVVTATKSGTISGKISIPPSTSEGTYPIIATGEVSGQSATATFTVTPPPVSVTVSPQNVTPGTIVTVTGSGFRSGEVVDIYWGSASGPLLGYRTADSSGAFTGRVTVPGTAGTGTHTIVARGRTSMAPGSATVDVTVPTPQVTVSPTSQTSGKVVSVSGSGFQSNEIVDIRWNDTSGRLLGYVTASSTGTVSGRVTVPAGTVPGTYSIVMIGRTSQLSGSASLTVTGATVTVTPSQAAPGTVVAVSGSGFGSGERVDIRWNSATGTLLGYRTTSSGGSMSGKVTIPADAKPGTYTLHLQGQDSGIVGSVKIEVRVTASTGDYGFAWWRAYGGGMVWVYSARPML